MTMNVAAKTRQFLLFHQGESLFTVEVETVREVLNIQDYPISPVPNSPEFLLGLTNLRGEILAVADFGRFIAVQPVNLDTGNSRILVIEAPDPQDVRLPLMRMGLAVSQVTGVVLLNPDHIVSAVDASEELMPFLKGLYYHQGQLLMMIDTEAIAHSERW